MTLRPTNQKEKQPGISFHNDPDELVMTMTMTNLRTSDSNRYWCAVKIGGLLRTDIKASLDLTVTEGIPDLSVASNMVSSEKGGNITVECIYSEKLKGSEKKWCKSGDLHSCQTSQDLKSSPDAAVQINDTNDGVFRVTLTGLKKADLGWYWCMAGGLQAPVHINVTSEQPSATNTGPSTSTMIPWSSYSPTKSFTINPSTFTNVNRHNSGATSKLPESSSDENEKISTASPKQLSTTIYSSTYPTTRNKYSSHSSGITTLLTSGSATVSNSSVSSGDHKSPFECRDLVCVIMIVCGVLLLIFILSGIWTLWSWHRKGNTGEDATEITTELLYIKANDKDDDP